MKAIVVGGGIMGLATAWALAREGHAVELFEQGPLPNPLASSMDEHRLIRHPYGDQRGLCAHDRPGLRRLGPAVGRSRPASLRRHRHAGAHRQRRDLGRALGRHIGRHRQVDEGDAARRAATALSAARRARRRTRLLDGQRRRAVRPGHRRGAGAASRRAAERDACMPRHAVRTVDLEHGRDRHRRRRPPRRRRGRGRGGRLGRPAAAGGPPPGPVPPGRHLFRPACRPARDLGKRPDGHRQDRRCRPLPRAAGRRPRPQDRRPCLQPDRRPIGRAPGA